MDRHSYADDLLGVSKRLARAGTVIGNRSHGLHEIHLARRGAKAAQPISLPAMQAWGELPANG